MRSSRRWMIPLCVAAATCLPGCDFLRSIFGGGGAERALVVITPAEGAYVFTNQVVRFEAAFDPPRPAAPVDLRLDVTGPGETRTVAAGDLRSPAVPSSVLALWRPREEAPGDYRLALSGTVDGKAVSVTRTVHLQQPPVGSIAVAGFELSGSQAYVRLQAKASSPSGNAIASYRWAFGAEAPPGGGGGAEVTQPFRFEPGAQYPVTVDVVDDKGGTTILSATILMQAGPPVTVVAQAATTCGCRLMRVHLGPGSSHAYCGAHSADFGGFEGFIDLPADSADCPAGAKVFQGKLGKLATATAYGFGFEVEAVLNPGSDVTKCTEGQYASITRTSGGVLAGPNPATGTAPAPGPRTLPSADGGVGLSFTAIDAGVPEPQTPTGMGPFGPPVVGADDYDSPSEVKRHQGLTVRWLDIPQTVGGTQPMSQQDQFITFIRGPTGTCWCHFTISQPSPDGGASTPLADSLNCSLVP